MNIPLPNALIDDTRAVTPVIAFVLLFGIGMIAFSGYQAYQVPQQNAETEFQHYQDVQNDLIVVRNAISRAGQQNQPQFESVRLGTTYRERIFALNPPDPAGTLRTEGPYEIKLVNATEEETVETRFLEYRNGYNELDIEPIYYENSVLYLNSSESGQRVFFEDQNLVQYDNTVVITALQREFSRSATGRVTLELYPTEAGDSLPTKDVDVTLPTRLPKEYWSDQIADAGPIRNFGYNNRSENVNQVKFTVDELEFNTVGIDDVPKDQGSASEGGGPEGNEEPFNLVSIDKSKGGQINFEIENTANNQITVTDFSVEFKYEGEYRGQNVDIIPEDGIQGERTSKYDIDGEYKRLNKQNAIIDGGSGVDVYLKDLEEKNNGWTAVGDLGLVQASNPDNADVIVRLKFESGEQTFYFEEE